MFCHKPYLRDVEVDLLKVVYYRFILSFDIHHAIFLPCQRSGAAVLHLLEGALTQEAQKFHLHGVQLVLDLKQSAAFN